MSHTNDARVKDALSSLPGTERRSILRKRYKSSLDSMVGELGRDESVRAVACAVNSSFGRGVLALTDTRLIFCCTRSGPASWALGDLVDVDGREGRFPMSAAITLHLAERTRVFALGNGRRYGPAFTSAVRDALRDSLPTGAAA